MLENLFSRRPIWNSRAKVSAVVAAGAGCGVGIFRSPILMNSNNPKTDELIVPVTDFSFFCERIPT